LSDVIRQIERYVNDGFDIIRVETKNPEDPNQRESWVWLGDVMGKLKEVTIRLQDREDERYVRERLGRTG
jgi:hypothetical protein